MALPGQGKAFDAFQQDDFACRQYAAQITGGQTPANAAGNAAVGSAVVGTALGAGVGAALGSLGGAVGTGAAVGGAAGLLAGSAVGANSAQIAGATAQQRYDTGYTQCMYARNNTVQAPPPPAYAAYPAPYAYAPGYGYYGPPWYGPYYGGTSVYVGGGWGWGPRRRYWGW